MGSSKTSSKQQLEFKPEALQALGSELTFQFGQLNPIQREQILKAAQFTLNQPGAGSAQGVFPPGLFQPVNAAVRTGANRMGVQGDQLAPLLEALSGGRQQLMGAAIRQGGQTVKGIPSFVDPRFANIMSPTASTDTKSTPSALQTGLQVGSAAIGAAGVAIAAIAI
jgi:hypothetical protein